MEIDKIIQDAETNLDEVDIVFNYSIAIEHLMELKEQISFADNPIPLRNKLNKCIHKEFLDLIDRDINRFKEMIRLHTEFKRKQITIDNKPKTSIKTQPKFIFK